MLITVDETRHTDRYRRSRQFAVRNLDVSADRASICSA